MCELIPAYKENIAHLIASLPAFQLPNQARICDLGAGTGNYICALAEALPNASFVHVDMDPVMNMFAGQKYADRALKNVAIHQEYIQRIEFGNNEFDLILCVNALNTAPPQLPVLRKIRSWLKPSGTLYVIDFGRRQRILDWGWYILVNTIKNYGVTRYLRALIENREAVRQNRRASRDQLKGAMWLHTHGEFCSVVERAGFKIHHSDICYRGYCDRVVAKRSSNDK